MDTRKEIVKLCILHAAGMCKSSWKNFTGFRDMASLAKKKKKIKIGSLKKIISVSRWQKFISLTIGPWVTMVYRML